MSMQGHVVITFNVHKDGAITDLDGDAARRPIDVVQQRGVNALVASNPTQPLPPEYPSDKAFFTVTFFYNEDAAVSQSLPTRPQQLGLLILLAAVRRSTCSSGCSVCAAGSSPSSGRPRPARARSARAGRALRRRDHQLRFDRRLSRLRHRHRQGAASHERRGIPHHLIDIVDPTEEYTAAQYARDAAAAIRDIHARGRLPILVGGTGLLLPRADARAVSRARAATRALRARLEAIAARRGVERSAPHAAARRSGVGARAFSRAI